MPMRTINVCSRCHAKFATLDRALAHVAKRHPDGATWATEDGNVTLWDNRDADNDAPWIVVCERHHQSVEIETKALALKFMHADEFCDVCNGVSLYCDECDMTVNSWHRDVEWTSNHTVGTGPMAGGQ